MSAKRMGSYLSRGRASALVIVLSLVVIVSIMLATFVAMMQMDRLASASYGYSLVAEQVGQGALNRVVAELRQEMSADADPDVVSGKAVYANVSASNLMPQRFGTNALMPSLVRTSVEDVFKDSTGGDKGTLKASDISTSAPSHNGRYLHANRWGAPYLGSFPDNASLPHWILVTRGGATNAGSFGTTGDTLNNPSPGNTNYAIGRFAYAVYNTGGLLDATVAGFPNGLGPDEIDRLKGSLAGADLSAVGITDANAFVLWRNAATAASAGAYLDYVTNFASTNGSRSVKPGDTTFLSRQDLIKAATDGTIDGLSADALPHLTVFTREKNAPSWGPTTDAPNPFDYATKANASASANRFIPLVRFPAAATITSYRRDGSAFTYDVQAGDPLVQRRFFLGRLAWIGSNGPQNGGTPDGIRACFGLRWDVDNEVWQYVGSTGSTLQDAIKTLDQVANEPTTREPNFFELLQAAILTGSLGVSSTPGVVDGVVAGAPTVHQASSLLQIMRIGAALIDQYDSDSYPTVIEYTEPSVSATWQAVGVEDLPYVNSFRAVVGTSPDTPAAAPSALAIYYTVGLWNPHQALPVVSPRPRLRVRVQGNVNVGTGYGSGAVQPFGLTGYAAAMDGSIELSAAGADGFRAQALLSSASVEPAPSGGSASGLAWTQTPVLTGAGGITAVAFRLPDLNINIAATTPASPWPQVGAYNSVYMRFPQNTPFQVSMEYQAPSGSWVPYSFLNGVNDSQTWLSKTANTDFAVWFGRIGGTPAQCLDAARFDTAGYNNYASARVTAIPADPPPNNTRSPLTPAGYYIVNPIRMAIDPRSQRFTWFTVGGASPFSGMANISLGGHGPFWSANMSNDSAFQPAGYGFDSAWAPSLFGPGVPPLFLNANAQYFPARISRNNTDNTGTFTSYADRDGVRRIGDSGMFPSATDGASGNPYGREADRPLVLNRPFQSVAEMGYALRDDPWRSLDFFSSESADAALLDLFSLSESDDGVVAGKIDLNSQDSQALEAVLRGILPDITATGPLSNPAAIAASLSNFTATSSNHLVNKADLVTRFVGDTSLFPASTDENEIKARREAVSRALADVGQTRTWNLLIDLVAQSGKYPPSATSLDQFVVEGERRYWLHVAIDRFTGEIADQQLEQVTE